MTETDSLSTFFVASAMDAGDRLDKVMVRHLPHLSRSRIKSLIEAGHVHLEGRLITEASGHIKQGQTVSLLIPPPSPATPMGEALPLTVVYEDDVLIVIDKPAGLVVHPAGGHESGTLVNALIAHCGESLSGIGGVKRPGIVHRLDKDTSGLMVVAKTDRAHQGLAKQFADHGRNGPLERAYLAFVWGAPSSAKGTVHTGIERSSHNREKMAAVPIGRGRGAITHFSIIERYGKASDPLCSLIECRLETGRTHQIRVHLAHLGHPLLGDPVYGSGYKTKAALLDESSQFHLQALGRQALHAKLLGFEHPLTGAHLSFESPLPLDLASLHENLIKISS